MTFTPDRRPFLVASAIAAMVGAACHAASPSPAASAGAIRAVAAASPSAPAQVQAPPPTEARPVSEVLHGERFIDDYRWLEALEKDSAEVAAWTTAQNDHTRAVLDALPCRAALESRLAELMTVGAVSAPVTRGNRYFYTERSGTQNQPTLLMREGHDGQPFALLDVSALDDRGLYALDWWVPSPDGSRVAFGLSYAGDEMTTLHVLDVDGGTWLPEEIPGKVGFGGWAPEGNAFLYTRLSDPANPYSRTVRWHELGRHHRHDPILAEQAEPSRIPYGILARNGRWITMGLTEGWSRNDLDVVDVGAWRRSGEFAPVPLARGLKGRSDPAAIIGDTMYMTTTVDAPNGRCVAVDLTDPDPARWRTVLPERADAVLQGVSHALGMLVATYQKDAASIVERFRLDGTPLGPLALPGIGSAGIAVNDDRTEAFLSFTSFNDPSSIYRVDLADGERSLWARPEVAVDPSTIEVRQEWATSKDGTRVPMFIVHRRGLSLDGENPTLVYAYGGFNVSLTPNFRAERFAWLERGGVFVQVNLRGGGEFGEAWHQAGMRDRKQNVYDDLYAATERLIELGYATPKRIAVLGGSNGGLLTGVAAAQRPDLYAAAISMVPLLDMLRYHEFLMARFWIPEFGSAEDPEQFAWLRAYSPYHNLREGVRYPAMFITAGENDTRVHPLHARKMTALMQRLAATTPDAAPVLLWVDRDGGHGQGKPLALRIREAADLWSFVLWQTGACADEGRGAAAAR
ncbi:MAG TPA: prolyl oligopeptidase family serine peptidase [Phycisphaerales bacterium]|nr:prolyl oligopeptidase family serine peptidase [Phycisphaerales bacterium]HMP36865.1 prolyl oligopeptidase family serine peptidase [Phycisphaerales bacterium]